MQLNVAYEFQPKQPSCRAAVVMDHFGIGFETGPFVIAADWELPIRRGDVVCFTGASGSGKSSLMRAAANQLIGEGQTVLNLDELDLGHRILIKAIELPVAEAMAVLAACGLSEARLLLRTPQELSDGQRYRFRLALAIAQQPDWIVADEFSATLDRPLAKVIAFNLRRQADRSGIGFLLATTHEDVLEDLSPSLHVLCRLDGRIECRGQRPAVGGQGKEEEPKAGGQSGRDPLAAQKKSPSASSTTSTLPPARHAIGRTSLGGITAAITSAS